MEWFKNLEVIFLIESTVLISCKTIFDIFLMFYLFREIKPLSLDFFLMMYFFNSLFLQTLTFEG